MRMNSYSIGDAMNPSTELVQEAERHEPIEITRRGRPVAVLLSIQNYQRLQNARRGFADTYDAFRREHDVTTLDIEPGMFDDMRAQDSGRPVEL